MRIYSLDLLKVVAVYLVICSHVSLHFMLQTPQDFGVLFLRQAGQFGVVIFYMASGYFLLNNRHADQFSYAYGKAMSLAIALVVWLVFYYFYDQVFLAQFIDLPAYDFGTFMETNATLSEATHLWFLFSIIGLYFILPLLRAAFVDSNQKMLLQVILMLLLVANITVIERALQGILDHTGLIHFSMLMSSQVYGLVCFLMGGYLGLTYKPICLSVSAKMALWVVAVISFSLLTWQTQCWGIVFFYGKYYNLLLQITAISVFYVMLHSRFDRFATSITRLGGKTLGIYLVHNIFVMEINGGFYHDALFSHVLFLGIYGYIVVYALAAFMASYALTCLLSKNRWLNKVVSL